MKLLLLLFTSLFNYAFLHDLCTAPENMCSEKHVLDNCKVESVGLEPRDCSQISFAGHEKLNNHLGDLILQVHLESETQLFLNISFLNVTWTKAYLRLSDDNNKNNNFCKMYTVEPGSDQKFPVGADRLYDSCFWNLARSRLRASPYLLEFRAENIQCSMYKKLLFDMPDVNNFRDTIPLSNRSLFAYIDITSSQEIVLNIQTLPKFYNVTYYKVEVIREREAKNTKESLLKEFLYPTYKENQVISYKYHTSNEEGHYYFAISAGCYTCYEKYGRKTTTTSKVYISRKGTPLVIGIVGASFIIPFVLFIFHMWNRRFKPQGGFPDTVEKILILFKPSSDKHNDVVTTLAKTVKQLTGIEVMSDPVNLPKNKPKNADKWCSDNLILATYIVYIAPPENDENSCELDDTTYNFLKAEMKKSNPDKDIIILKFPYSTSDLPSILVNCLKFELMGDFQKFLNVFQPPVTPDFNYENNINYMDLMKKITLAQAETDASENKDFPKIVITDQSDQSDEPKEIDVLL